MDKGNSEFDALWQGLDFTSREKLSRVPPLLAALRNGDVEHIRECAQKASPSKGPQITQWLCDNFSEPAADILLVHDLIAPRQMWGWSIEHRTAAPLRWWLADSDRIQLIFSPSGKSRSDDPTAKDWLQELSTLSALVPDVYLKAMEKADWGKLMSYGRFGGNSLLVGCWVNAFVRSEIDPVEASLQFSRVLSPEFIKAAYGSFKGFNIATAQAALTEPLHKNLLQADTLTAARIKTLIESSPVLRQAWLGYWKVNPSDSFARMCGYSDHHESYRLPEVKKAWGNDYRSFVPTSLLESMLCRGTPALCTLINQSPSPQDNPNGPAAHVCAAIENHPELVWMLLNNASARQAPALAAKLSVWLPNLTFYSLSIPHLAILAHPTPGMAMALRSADTSENLLELREATGTSVMDLFIAKAYPSEDVLDRVRSAKAQKVRKALTKLASPGREENKKPPLL